MLGEEYPQAAGTQHWVALLFQKISEYQASLSRLIFRNPVTRPQSSKSHASRPQPANKISAGQRRITSKTLPATQEQKLKRLQKEYSALLHSSSAASQKLKDLENMLRHNRLRHSALLYYQLINLWSFCHQQLEIHKKQLTRLQVEKETNKLLEEYRLRQKQESQTNENRCTGLEKTRQQLNSKKRSIKQDINSKIHFWQFLARKDLANELKNTKLEIVQMEKELAEIRIVRTRLEASEPPKLKRLSIDGKRAVNNHLIAYAQFYFASFLKNKVSHLTLSARDKPPMELNFGAPDKCQKLEQLINDKKEKIKTSSGLNRAVGPQAKVIASQGVYADDTKTVPAISSLDFRISTSTFEPGQPANPKADSAMINVVQENYWDIDQLFLR